ncbi:MAG: xanthine phosphoribosyltransferase [Candidatus Obscuribacterales bacterium]|nr:xanthine phosphoribosyltransferase [Candidatus Obscuribacterales bacterium]
MQILKDRIRKDGKHLGKGVLKVDNFMNHQIDPILMKQIGDEFAKRFKDVNATKILTAETSGIAPALVVAIALELPLVFARKKRPITMGGGEPFRQVAPSPTKGGEVELIVSTEYLGPQDKVLIIDDFLATAKTLQALVQLVKEAGAELVGIGAVIEKSFQGGRDAIGTSGIKIESLAVIESFDGDTIIFEGEKIATT